MKWKRTKKGSKDHTKDGKPTPTDEDDQTLEIDERDERDESDSEDNFNIQVDSPPAPDIDEPPALEVKTEREESESNPFYCSLTKRPDLLSPHHFMTNTNFTRFNHCPPPPPPPPPPFTLRQNPFLRRETEATDNQN